MAVLSTLRFLGSIPAHQRHQTQLRSFGDHVMYSADNSMAPPYTLEQPLHSTLHTFGSSLHTDQTRIDGRAHVRASHDHQQAPTDGGKVFVWHCSHCGDGPIGDWQNCCQNCGHKKCGSCTVEET
jgi:hypothetical protein